MAERKPAGAGADANPVRRAGADSSSAPSSGVGSSRTKEAFAECLAVAANKHQELAALHLADAWSARLSSLEARLRSEVADLRALASSKRNISKATMADRLEATLEGPDASE